MLETVPNREQEVESAAAEQPQTQLEPRWTVSSAGSGHFVCLSICSTVHLFFSLSPSLSVQHMPQAKKFQLFWLCQYLAQFFVLALTHTHTNLVYSIYNIYVYRSAI